jgi:hypothetical protein
MTTSEQARADAMPYNQRDLWLPAHAASKHTSADAGHSQGLRVYPDSPGAIAVQVRTIRGTTQIAYATARLTPEQAIQLRNHLSALLVNHFGFDAEAQARAVPGLRGERP